MSDIYSRFKKYIGSLTDDTITNFKSNKDTTYMLEHVTFDEGLSYLELIRCKTTITTQQIKDYCIKNDTIGGGLKYDYGFINTSPSNFRYLFHSHLILSHLQELQQNNIRMVEVGCGYGGLCVALDFLSPIYNITISKYHLIDLPEISELQQNYLLRQHITIPLEFHSAYNYGSEITDRNMFFVSNYCFSEISDKDQKLYRQILFPKVSHGFMAWNMIPLYDFGFKYREEEEYPLTGEFNKYVYF